MRRSGTGSGGGLGSRPVTHAKAPKAEPRPNKMNVKGVSQIGQSIGDHITEKGKVLKNVIKPLHDGRGYSPPVGPTDNVKAVGVAGGRNVYKSGAQHGLATRANNSRGRSFDD